MCNIKKTAKKKKEKPRNKTVCPSIIFLHFCNFWKFQEHNFEPIFFLQCQNIHARFSEKSTPTIPVRSFKKRISIALWVLPVLFPPWIPNSEFELASHAYSLIFYSKIIFQFSHAPIFIYYRIVPTLYRV